MTGVSLRPAVWNKCPEQTSRAFMCVHVCVCVWHWGEGTIDWSVYTGFRMSRETVHLENSRKERESATLLFILLSWEPRRRKNHSTAVKSKPGSLYHITCWWQVRPTHFPFLVSRCNLLQRFYRRVAQWIQPKLDQWSFPTDAMMTSRNTFFSLLFVTENLMDELWID